MLAMIAGLHSPRRTAQVNAIDQGFGTDRVQLRPPGWAREQKRPAPTPGLSAILWSIGH
jgi:hypothetical protein